MSADVIKQIFIKNAYSWAMKYAKPINVNVDSSKQTSENPIYIDPFYKYVYYIKKIATNGKSPANLNDIYNILGRKETEVISGIKNGINMYAKVLPPKQWHLSALPEFDEYSYKSFALRC